MSNVDEKVADEESIKLETASELNLNSNVEARIKNPLAGIPRARLLRNVEIFANEKQLTEELPILSKGAICEFIQRHTTSFTRSHPCFQWPKVLPTLKRSTSSTIVTRTSSGMNTLTDGATRSCST